MTEQPDGDDGTGDGGREIPIESGGDGEETGDGGREIPVDAGDDEGAASEGGETGADAPAGDDAGFDGDLERLRDRIMASVGSEIEETADRLRRERDEQVGDLRGESEATIGELEEEVREMRATLGRLGDDLDDLEGRFEDHVRRSEREREEIRQRAVEDFVEEVLDVKGSFTDALEIEEFDEGTERRMRMIDKQFEQVLRKGNVDRIDDPGEPFDSLRHRIVDKVDSEEHETNEIVEIREPGYEMGDRVLEQARVVLAR